MDHAATVRFRQRCRQFRWLAIFMVVSVASILALVHLVSPAVAIVRGAPPLSLSPWLTEVVRTLPVAFYLFAVWSVGTAMGQLAKGRLVSPTLAQALHRVGLALGLGGVVSVFGVTNAIRLIEGGSGGFAFFDVAGMTLGIIGGALYLLSGVIEHADRIQTELDEMI